MKRIGILFIAVLWTNTAVAIQIDTMYYKVVHDNHEQIVEWIITPLADNLQEIRSFNASTSVSQIITCDSNFATLTWEYDNPAEATQLSVQRVEKTLHFSSTSGKESKLWSENVGKKPWFQFPGLALTNFVQQDQEEMSFLVVKVENGKVYTMKAKSQLQEFIHYQDKPINAQKVTVSLKGFLSAFGKVHFWICGETTRFVRFEGFSGVFPRKSLTYQLIDYRSAINPGASYTTQTTNRTE